MNNSIFVFLKSILPIPLYFFGGLLLQEHLLKYTVAGPVDHKTGQPIFSDYPSTVFYAYMCALVIGLVWSAYHLIKQKGWPLYLSLAIIFLSLPMQYLFIVAVQLKLFGK